MTTWSPQGVNCDRNQLPDNLRFVSDPSSRIIVFAGSARRDSVNKHVARVAARLLDERGADARFLDLADYEMPLYHGEIEADHGVPDAGHALAAEFAPATGLLIASPEYNGAMTALLKNTVDWVTRIDRAILRDKYFGLMSATPGPRGGTRGLTLVRQWLESMRLPVTPEDLSIPNIHEVLDSSGEIVRFDDDTMQRMGEFLDGYVIGLGEHEAALQSS